MNVIAIDPGLRCTGVSVWRDGKLHRAELVYNPVITGRGPAAWFAMADAVYLAFTGFTIPDTLVVELQQKDRRGFNADDMFQVCGVTGAIVGMFGDSVELVGYYPRQWSRVPKAIRHKRLYTPGLLSETEWARVKQCSASLKHNRDDAICLGLYHLGRK